MFYDQVPASHKADARDLIRLARRRGAKLKLTKEELADPERMRKFFAIYGNPPSDSLFGRAKQIADHVGVILTTEQAMNIWHCRKFIADYKSQAPHVMPSDKQIWLAEKFAKEYLEIDIPDGVCGNLTEWKAFFEDHLGPEERDILYEIESKFARKINFDSYGDMISNLVWYKKINSDPVLLEREMEKRIRKLLIGGCDRFSVADDLNVGDDAVGKQIQRLETEGYLLIY